MKQIIHTDKAPRAIGAYSQAVKVDNTVYVSGQLGLDPETMEFISDDFIAQAEQVFKNLSAVAEAAGGTLQDFVKFNVFLTDLSEFAKFNEVMSKYVSEPYPARAAVEISALPKGGVVEVEGIIFLTK